jgi:malonyl-CoA O-methyltransferase
MTKTPQAPLPDKRRVAESFSRAAQRYDSVAALQRRVGEQLLARLPTALAPVRWLDLGSGTGHFSRVLNQRYPAARGVALDLAEGMLRHARPLGGADSFIAGDAERLPLRSGSLDLIFSSLALQWCEDFAAVLNEAQRVLRPGGVLAFTSLCQGSLAELRDSWRQVDGFVHVNRFRALEAYQALCDASGLRVLGLERQPEVEHFANLRTLTGDLKTLGAHNLNPGRPDGLTGRARIQALTAAYESLRTEQGLPLTYQVVYGLLQKS